jgi:hypothetical protein
MEPLNRANLFRPKLDGKGWNMPWKHLKNGGGFVIPGSLFESNKSYTLKASFQRLLAFMLITPVI